MLLAILVALAPLPRQSDDFDWRKALASGKTIEIVGVNGSIDASAAAGGEVEVHAVKQGRKSDPAEVEIDVIEHADGVTICAVYPSSRRGETNECRPGGKSHMNTRNNDVKVTWTLKVPRGVRFVGRTVNGHISARGLRADAEAYTVNGSIDLETSAWASASTVNGSITAQLGRTDWSGESEFSTVNGGITLDLPSGSSMEVAATTVNGSLTTEFPLTVKGRWGPKRMSGTIGEGGRTLSLSTVNGSLQLRKAP